MMPTLRPCQPTVDVSLPEGYYHPHPSSPFIIIISQPESWYSFHWPMEGGRPSRLRHCSKCAACVQCCTT